MSASFPTPPSKRSRVLRSSQKNDSHIPLLDSDELMPTEQYSVSANLLPPQTRWGRFREWLRRINDHIAWKKVLIISIVLLLTLLIAGVGYIYYVTTHSITENGQTGFFGQVKNIVTDNGDPLRGETDNRINVLLLGKGGDGHAGGGLVDTVMVASIQPSTKEVALISLPRDLVIPHYPNPNSRYPEYRKINTMMTLGGIDFATETMQTVLGLDMHYYAVVDFTGFRSVVDTIGGIEIVVPNGFTGYYGANELSEPCPPKDIARLEDGAYCAITFTAGTEQMNGERALQYARIRKMAPRSENPEEGTDFKRAARQQIVLEAMKSKMMSITTLLNPVRINGLLHDLGDHVSTDMEVWEMLRFAEMVRDVDRTKIKNLVVDQGEGGLVRRDPTAAAYILVPNAGLGNYSELQALALNVFDESTVASEQRKQRIAAERPVVIVQNGTNTAGLASRTSSAMQTAGIPVSSFMNAATKDVATTMIFDLSGNTKPETRAALEQYFHATATDASMTQDDGARVEISGNMTEIIGQEELPRNVDFVIVLGADAERAPLREVSQNAENTNTTEATTDTEAAETKTEATHSSSTNTHNLSAPIIVR